MVDAVQFPCLSIHNGTMFTVPTYDHLTTTTTAALRRGYFEKLRIVDSAGTEFFVKSVRKLHGIGPLWGFNITLNRWIRVALDLEPTGKVYSADDVRKIVAKDFETWDGWESREDFDELKDSVMQAKSSAEILRRLTKTR